ncbi:MAG: hypothetical protein HW386_1159 [Gammaproteobacteria bacterium]|nr:hypothetical protein [Gammaproteobacteria bacterium]
MNVALLLAIILSGLCYSGSAYAYLDPGTGSFILQMLIAGIMGIILTAKLYWYRLIDFFKRHFGKTENNKDTQPDENNTKAD